MAGHPPKRRNGYYAYILQSVAFPDRLYHGHSSDLRQRLSDYNSGHCPHTANFVPWKVKLYAAFETLEGAQQFERYLKSGSGHSFARRHLL
jgi:predicted GIY-YIG superfamily endonuclease